MKEQVLLSYSTRHLVKKDKVRFFYALNGRAGSNGMLKLTNAERLGRAVLSVEPKHIEEMREFLKYWHCQWQEVPLVVM